MRPAHRLIIIAFAVVVSMAAPALLAACGVVDRDLLVIVFVPSVVVGVLSAWFARRWSSTDGRWLTGPDHPA